MGPSLLNGVAVPSLPRPPSTPAEKRMGMNVPMGKSGKRLQTVVCSQGMVDGAIRTLQDNANQWSTWA